MEMLNEKEKNKEKWMHKINAEAKTEVGIKKRKKELTHLSKGGKKQIILITTEKEEEK